MSEDDLFSSRLMELPDKVQKLAVLMATLELPEGEGDKIISMITESIRSDANAIQKNVEGLSGNLSDFADLIDKKQHKCGSISEAEKRLLDCCDEGLALLMRDSYGLNRAEQSENRELTCTACGTMHETEAFLRVLRRDLELSENETERRDTLQYFADHVHRQSEALADLIEAYPDSAKGIGSDYPNWPFLMFRRDNLPVDYRRQADKIGLGDTCVVNPSPRVNWTPLQKYLFTIFWEWQDVKRFLEYQPIKGDDRTETERVKTCLAYYPLRPKDSITDVEAKLFLESLRLPSLTKERVSRKQWSEVFLIPLIDIREANIEDVPAFSVWLNGDNVKVRDHNGMLAALKEGVIRALEAMARDNQG